MRVDSYDSIQAFINKVNEKSQNGTTYSHIGERSGGREWDNGVTRQEALRLSQQGDPSLVAQTSSMVDKLVDEFVIKDEIKQRYIPSMTGSRVSVPDYLAGSPRCMRQRKPSEIQTRSVNLFVNMSSSGGVKATTLLQRGTTILALLEFLSLSQISVELFLVCETDGQTDGDYIQVIKVESHPLDLSVVGFAIAHPAFDRKVCMYMADLMDGFQGMWPRSRNKGGYQERLKKNIGAAESDIYIPEAGLWDDLLVSNPKGWLAERIETIRGTVKDG